MGSCAHRRFLSTPAHRVGKQIADGDVEGGSKLVQEGQAIQVVLPPLHPRNPRRGPADHLGEDRLGQTPPTAVVSDAAAYLQVTVAVRSAARRPRASRPGSVIDDAIIHRGALGSSRRGRSRAPIRRSYRRPDDLSSPPACLQHVQLLCVDGRMLIACSVGLMLARGRATVPAVVRPFLVGLRSHPVGGGWTGPSARTGSVGPRVTAGTPE